jgi:hypothetical protein
MDDKVTQLRDDLLLLIVVFTVEVGTGIRFDRLYRPFNYGFGTISDLLKRLVNDGLVAACFDLHDQPQMSLLPNEEQIKRLQLCFDQSTYIFLTLEGRDFGLQILQKFEGRQ